MTAKYRVYNCNGWLFSEFDGPEIPPEICCFGNAANSGASKMSVDGAEPVWIALHDSPGETYGLKPSDPFGVALERQFGLRIPAGTPRRINYSPEYYQVDLISRRIRYEPPAAPSTPS